MSLHVGIEGLGTVLCAVVDYKGQRIIGQSIIPGIFTQGENSATLLYGILDKAKPINVSVVALLIVCLDVLRVPSSYCIGRSHFFVAICVFARRGNSHPVAAALLLVKSTDKQCKGGVDFCIYNRP